MTFTACDSSHDISTDARSPPGRARAAQHDHSLGLTCEEPERIQMGLNGNAARSVHQCRALAGELDPPVASSLEQIGRPRVILWNAVTLEIRPAEIGATHGI